MAEYTGHHVSTERSTRKMRHQGYWKLHFRWVCETCGQRGDWVPTLARARDGAGWHEYANRPMTADEVRTMGDGMNADLTPAQAQERANAFNDSLEERTR